MSQDEELDKILVNFFNEAEEDVHSSNFNEGFVLTKAHTKAKQAIQALYRTREATLIREARLDELKLVTETMIIGDSEYVSMRYFEQRITQLTNQQEGDK